MAAQISQVLAQKLDEDLALIGDLLLLVPQDSHAWRPDWPGPTPFTCLELVQHLLDSTAALCACLHRLHPKELRHLEEYRRSLPPLDKQPFADLTTRFQKWRHLVAEGFALLEDSDLVKPIVTYFHPEGEVWCSVLLNNWKHTNHHAYQLFHYLKLQGVPVSTRNLYRFVDNLPTAS